MAGKIKVDTDRNDEYPLHLSVPMWDGTMLTFYCGCAPEKANKMAIGVRQALNAIAPGCVGMCDHDADSVCSLCTPNASTIGPGVSDCLPNADSTPLASTLAGLTTERLYRIEQDIGTLRSQVNNLQNSGKNLSRENSTGLSLIDLQRELDDLRGRVVKLEAKQ